MRTEHGSTCTDMSTNLRPCEYVYTGTKKISVMQGEAGGVVLNIPAPGIVALSHEKVLELIDALKKMNTEPHPPEHPTLSPNP